MGRGSLRKEGDLGWKHFEEKEGLSKNQHRKEIVREGGIILGEIVLGRGRGGNSSCQCWLDFIGKGKGIKRDM